MLACPLVLLTSPRRQARTLCSPCRLHAPPCRGHTLPHSLPHWTPYNHYDALESHDTPLGARVFSVPNQSGFSSPCLTHTCLTVRAGGQNTLWGTHLFHSLQRYLLQPDILCSVKFLLLSSSELAGWPGARAHLQPLAGLESPVLTPEQHLCQAPEPTPPKLGEPAPEKGTAPLHTSLLPLYAQNPRDPMSCS